MPLSDSSPETSGPNIGGKNVRQMPLSSPSSKFLRIRRAGMVTKITVSRSSIYSEKPLYFSEVPSIIYVK